MSPYPVTVCITFSFFSFQSKYFNEPYFPKQSQPHSSHNHSAKVTTVLQ